MSAREGTDWLDRSACTLSDQHTYLAEDGQRRRASTQARTSATVAWR